MATEEDLRKIVRRPDFVVFWYKNARCEANVAEGTWRVYRTEDEIKHRYDFLTRYDYVVVNQEEPAQLIEAYGARVKNDWENEEKPV